MSKIVTDFLCFQYFLRQTMGVVASEHLTIVNAPLTNDVYHTPIVFKG